MIRSTVVIAVAILCIFSLSETSSAQSDSYEVMPAPDLWYNSVDGVRIGGRVSGRVPGTFGEGPHRLDAGIWVGSKLPDYPVSYYISFTEPIPAISEFGNEGNINFESEFRTGFQKHGISFNKRWQEGFEERNYRVLSVGLRGEQRFEENYLLYNQLWQDQWLFLGSLGYRSANENSLGRYRFTATSTFNLAGNFEEFGRGEIAYQQIISLSEAFQMNARFYTGLTTNDAAPEYRLLRSMKSARQWMNSGLSRARGTIPPRWIEAGAIQFSGGGNLRGYLHQDVEALNNEGVPLYNSFSAVNMELDYPNPLDEAFNDIPMLGQFMDLRSYLFFDSGTSLGVGNEEETQLLSNAGPGFKFSINIPDYLGRARGLMIHYDLPLWLSHPGEENSFKFRHVIGVGAAITF